MENKIHRICIFSAYFHPHFGGVEQYNYQLATQMVKSGYQVYMVTFNTENQVSREMLNGFQIFRFPVFALFKERFPLPKMNHQFKLLFKEIRAFNPDCILANTRFYTSTQLALYLGKKTKKPLYIIEHGTGHLSLGNKFLDFLGRQYEHVISHLIRKYAGGFFGVSKACNQWLKHFGIESKGVVYNSVDTEHVFPNEYRVRELYNLPPDSQIIAFAGRLIKEKGVTELLAAFDRLSKKHQFLYLFIAGSGPLSETLSQFYANNPRIIFLGAVSHENVLDLLKDSGLVVIPSYYPEGLPTLILEAGLCKCAVVATPMGGTREVIDRNNGMIIQAGSAENIYSALECLISDPEIINNMAENLHQKVISSYGWKKTTSDFLETLNSLQIC